MKPKRILHVASRAERYLGARYYGIPYKINNGLIRAGHYVYWFSDRDMARYLAPIPSRKLGRGKCNKAFVEFCRNMKPEVLVLCHADIIRAETLLEVKKFLPDLRILQYNVDGLHIEANVEAILSRADIVDATFVTTGGSILSSVAGEKSYAAFMPNPVDPSIDLGEAHTHRDLPTDVFFAGGLAKWSEQTDLRALSIRQLRERLPDRKMLFSRWLWGTEFMETLSQSKIGLCFSHRSPDTYQGDGGTLYHYCSDRVGQYMENGVLTFVNKLNDLNSLYGDDAVVTIDTFDDLIEKVEYFLNNEDHHAKV